MTHMNEIFPIDGYPQQRYDATRAAFKQLIEDHWGTPEQSLPTPGLIIETFAGLGGQTRILAEAFPGALHRGWEKDAACYQQLALVHGAVADRFAASEVELGEYPTTYFDTARLELQEKPILLVVDGAYSLAQHEAYVPYHDERADYLIICEQARPRLHLHKKTYGLPEHLTGTQLYHAYLEKVARRHRRPFLGIRTTKYSPSYLLLGPVRK